MNKEDFYAEARNDVSGPLDGITVVEATTTWAGPMAGCVLAACWRTKTASQIDPK